MKISNYFFQKTIFILIAISFAFNPTSAQCDKKDNECWLEEGIYQIAEGDFEQAKEDLKKSYKGVFKKTPKEIKKEAKEILGNKIPNFYEPIKKHTTDGKQFQTDGFFVNAIEQFQAAEKLASRNKRFDTPHTKELDQKILKEIEEVLIILETERTAAVETAIAVGDEELGKENYPRALSNFTIALREGSVAEKATHQIQQKSDQCSFFVHSNKAKDFMASGSCETAYEHATKAVSYESSPAARRLLAEATDCAHENQIEEGNGQLEIGAYEKAITHFEQAKKYKSSSPEATKGITEAKNRTAQSYVEKAEIHFVEDNHAAAVEDFEKAMSFNSNVVNSEGESIHSLIDKHYDDLNGMGESLYAKNNYEEAAGNFKAASYYKNKELMEKRETFVLAVKVAADKEKESNRLASLDDLQQLQSLWYNAKRKNKGTDLTSGVNLEAKVKKMKKIVMDASLISSILTKGNTATIQEKNAARKGLQSMQLDCKFKKDGLAKLGSPYPIMTAIIATPSRIPYHFESHAKSASWMSEMGRLKSPLTFNVDKKAKGKAVIGTYTLENNNKRKVLYTHPKWVKSGNVVGHFKEIPVLPRNVKLQGSIGFLKIKNPRTDGARFKIIIQYYVGNQKKQETIVNTYKRYTGKLKTLNVDLSKYGGKKRVSFILRVDAGKTATDDRAIWENIVLKRK
ncbi:MAG: tetratricopeptide (TPR) repeat protein [Saprospiraceae bacterium]|jgi:tetratricopeptide (TPR) repeat protein